MRLNGRKIASGAQLQREMKRSMGKHVEDSLKKATAPGVRMKKTRDGLTLEGTPEQVKRMKTRLR